MDRKFSNKFFMDKNYQHDTILNIYSNKSCGIKQALGIQHQIFCKICQILCADRSTKNESKHFK
jgi:hypothetical protein